MRLWKKSPARYKWLWYRVFKGQEFYRVPMEADGKIDINFEISAPQGRPNERDAKDEQVLLKGKLRKNILWEKIKAN